MAWHGMASANPLDFSNPGELKTFHKAISPLQPEFDLKPEDLKVFLECVNERACIYDAILQVPDENAMNHHIINAYGLISLAQCHAHAATYVDTQTKNEQNSIMQYQLLSNTLTREAKNKIQINSALYHIGANRLP
jgi:hypothetical protein